MQLNTTVQICRDEVRAHEQEVLWPALERLRVFQEDQQQGMLGENSSDGIPGGHSDNADLRVSLEDLRVAEEAESTLRERVNRLRTEYTSRLKSFTSLFILHIPFSPI
jgi:hypothetical protein